jgi:hypothetical protein
MSISTHCYNRSALIGLAAAMLLIVAAHRAHAQSPAPDLTGTATGTTYIVAFPDTIPNVLDVRYPNTRVRREASLWIFSPTANRVEITPSTGTGTTLMINAGKFKIYQVPGAAVVDVNGAVIARSFLVKADKPIALFCYFASPQGVEAWTPLPVDRWGKRYRVAAVPGDYVKDIGIAGETEVPEALKPAPAEITIIGAYENTVVHLTPPAGVEFAGNASHTVTLNQGEVYQVPSYVDTSYDAESQQDIGATIVEADQPIGVISGNTRAQITTDVGLKNNAYKNMLIEWLRPTEQYGHDFVYMGTWDAHRPGIGAAAERKDEFVRLYSDEASHNAGYFLQQGGESKNRFDVAGGSFSEVALSAPTGTYFHTTDPAQVMMHSTAIVQYNGSTPCFRGIPCLSYSAWAPYMVELVPREQWTSFSPYYAPPNPGGMQHYVNVVTDTNSVLKIIRENGSTFLFNRRIPGTDLIWGSMSVSQGEDHWLMGKNGAKFWGFAYGVYGGGEEYRPGRARKRDDAPSTASGGDGDDANALHPCEYEEYNAVSYGYPFLSAGNVLGSSSVGRDRGDAANALAAFVDGDAVAIRYTLARSSATHLEIYNSAGMLVETLVDGTADAGAHELRWDASSHPAGYYFCTIAAGDWTHSVPVMIVR